MDIKNLLITLFVVTSWGCIFHGHCYRSIGGTIKTDLEANNLSVRICEDFGSGYGSNCDFGSVDSNGTYKLSNLLIDPQGECKNECKENNPTLPIRIGVKIYKTTAKGDSTLKEVNFSCQNDFTFAGNDIQLPIIEIQ